MSSNLADYAGSTFADTFSPAPWTQVTKLCLLAIAACALDDFLEATRDIL